MGHGTVSTAGYDGFIVAEITVKSVFCEYAFDAVPSSVNGVFAFQNDHSVVKGVFQSQSVPVAEENQDDEDESVKVLFFHNNLAIGR